MLPARKSCQDAAANWTTRTSLDDLKETQTAVVWSCFPFIRSGQNHLARDSEMGEEDKADRGRGGKTTPGNGQVGARQVPEGGGEQENMEETSCETICGAPTTLAVKG